ncbi:hypothetical protein [Limnoglobus roseus]|uniref:Uncharacterized protein n=1 Tax=Limnoglobus roseus TaxID=2598579 RepID=A0A5C1A679_9BACT|nr:hypothetical protein [Limnoglobus roseus]QEL13875.1 hypothetical protein PX52LOC_00733 [Limnoglobus roseus]
MAVSNGIDLDLRNLDYVRGSALNKAIRISLNAAAVPVKSAVVGVTPQKTGFLKKAMRIKTQFKNGVWAAVVGPSSSVKKVRKPPKKKKAKPKPKAAKITSKPATRAKRRKTRAGRFLARAVKIGKKRAKRAKKAAAKKAQSLRKRIVRSKGFKSLLKKVKGKPKKNYIRPAAYASILQWGSKRGIKAKHYLEKSYTRSAGEFTSLLTSKLKDQLSQMLTPKTKP